MLLVEETLTKICELRSVKYLNKLLEHRLERMGEMRERGR
jgi:hypothetical protein